MADTRTYFAMSVLNSRTMWLNVIPIVVGILSMTDVVALIPSHYMPMYTMIVAALNMILRTQTVRPVAFSSPGSVTPVQVAKLTPPAPKLSD